MMVVHAFIRFCMILNPTMCQELEIAPAMHLMASPVECMRGVMMGDQREFSYQGARWRIAGGSCREVPLTNVDLQERLRAAVSPQ
jgi:hypothetical protein